MLGLNADGLKVVTDLACNSTETQEYQDMVFVTQQKLSTTQIAPTLQPLFVASGQTSFLQNQESFQLVSRASRAIRSIVAGSTH